MAATVFDPAWPGGAGTVLRVDAARRWRVPVGTARAGPEPAIRPGQVRASCDTAAAPVPPAGGVPSGGTVAPFDRA